MRHPQQQLVLAGDVAVHHIAVNPRRWPSRHRDCGETFGVGDLDRGGDDRRPAQATANAGGLGYGEGDQAVAAREHDTLVTGRGLEGVSPASSASGVSFEVRQDPPYGSYGEQS